MPGVSSASISSLLNNLSKASGLPENINVAAAVSLAGIGLDRTQVCVVADPALERNTHEVVAEGTFGQMRFEIRGIPTETNPRTGRIVAMSVLSTLRRLRAPLVVG